MDNFTKLLLFLGQQYYVYHRRVFFIEELLQIYATEKEISAALEEPIKLGWLQPVSDMRHFEITPLAEANALCHWNRNVYVTGEVGGGTLRGNTADRRFTVAVEFDTPIKFLEHTTVNYGSRSIELNCVDGFYYEAKVHVSTEAEFESAEESINRYLSHLSFHYKIPISIRAMHSGSINVSSTTRRDQPRSGIYYTIPNLSDLQENGSRAVAFYRQFRNFSQIRTTESRYYQLISLLKIVEGVNPSADFQRNKNSFIDLVDRYLTTLSTELQTKSRGVESRYAVKYDNAYRFSEICWEHYRHGVAHWRARGNFLDPDVPDFSIATTINILEQIVLQVISNDYGITSK